MLDDDKQIIDFLTNEENFKDYVIDNEEHQENMQNKEVTNGNFMPKGVRTLEGTFDVHNKFRNPANAKTNSSSMQYELINLGTKVEPKYMNLGKFCSPGERSRFISLFQ